MKQYLKPEAKPVCTPVPAMMRQTSWDAGDGENLPVIDGNPDKEPDPYGGDESAKFNPWAAWDD